MAKVNQYYAVENECRRQTEMFCHLYLETELDISVRLSTEETILGKYQNTRKMPQKCFLPEHKVGRAKVDSQHLKPASESVLVLTMTVILFS